MVHSASLPAATLALNSYLLPPGPRSSTTLPCSATVPCDQGNCPSGFCDCGHGLQLNPVDCNVNHAPFSCQAVCEQASLVRLANDHLNVLVNIAQPALQQVAADWTGQQDWSSVTLGQGFRLERIEAGKAVYNPAAAVMTVLTNTSSAARIQLAGVVDDQANPSAQETWVLELHDGDRFLTLELNGKSIGSSSAPLVHSVGMQATSIYGLFEAGTVQMRGKSNAYFAATSQPTHVYTLGGNASVVCQSIESAPLPHITWLPGRTLSCSTTAAPSSCCPKPCPRPRLVCSLSAEAPLPGRRMFGPVPGRQRRALPN